MGAVEEAVRQDGWTHVYLLSMGKWLNELNMLTFRLQKPDRHALWSAYVASDWWRKTCCILRVRTGKISSQEVRVQYIYELAIGDAWRTPRDRNFPYTKDNE